jgi:hypothetical protein
VKAGWMVASAVDGAAVVIGYLPDELRPGKLGQQRAPAIKRKPTVSSTPGHARSQFAGAEVQTGRPRDARDRRLCAEIYTDTSKGHRAQNIQI